MLLLRNLFHDLCMMVFWKYTSWIVRTHALQLLQYACPLSVCLMFLRTREWISEWNVACFSQSEGWHIEETHDSHQALQCRRPIFTFHSFIHLDDLAHTVVRNIPTYHRPYPVAYGSYARPQHIHDHNTHRVGLLWSVRLREKLSPWICLLLMQWWRASERVH